MTVIGYLSGLFLLYFALQADTKLNETRKHQEFLKWYKEHSLEYDSKRIHKFSVCTYDSLKQVYVLNTYDDRETDYYSTIKNLREGDFLIPLPEYNIDKDGVYKIIYPEVVRIQ